MTFLFVWFKELLNSLREEGALRKGVVAFVFMTVSQTVVVCARMTEMVDILCCETLVTKPERLGLVKVTTSKGFLYLGLISITEILLPI